jgi:hypothetical protein
MHKKLEHAKKMRRNFLNHFQNLKALKKKFSYEI